MRQRINLCNRCNLRTKVLLFHKSGPAGGGSFRQRSGSRSQVNAFFEPDRATSSSSRRGLWIDGPGEHHQVMAVSALGSPQLSAIGFQPKGVSQKRARAGAGLA